MVDSSTRIFHAAGKDRHDLTLLSVTVAAPVLLLDGASMWFRSYFGVPSSITAPDGRPVNALRGFLDAVATRDHARTTRAVWWCAATTTGGRSGGWT